MRCLALHLPTRSCSCWRCLLAGCAVGPAYQRARRRKRRPPSRKRGAGCPQRRPTRSSAARGGSCSTIRCSTTWPRRWRYRTRTWRRRWPRTRRRARWSPSSARRCSRVVEPGCDAAEPQSAAAAAAPTRNSYRVSIGGSWEPDVWGRLRRRDQRPRRRAGQRGRPGRRQAGGPGRTGDQLLPAARAGRPASRCWPPPSTGYERRPEDHAEPLRGRHRRRKPTCCRRRPSWPTRERDLLTLVRQRAQLEHAIAVLVGKAPASSAWRPRPWTGTVPDIPLAVPSTLLQRRPDIAAAERRVAAANAQIGIARSAYFPNFGLTGSLGHRRGQHRRPVQCVGAAVVVRRCRWRRRCSTPAPRAPAWLGPRRRRGGGGALPPDRAGGVPGRRKPAGRGARPAGARCCAQQASEAADQVEQQMLNRYQAGQVGYTEVVRRR